MLANLLQGEIKKRGLSLRGAAAQIGVSHATLYRIYKGETVDMPTLEKIATWLNIRVASIVDAEASVDDVLMVLQERDPRLKQALERVAELYKNGEIDQQDLADIVDYMLYKLTLSSRRQNETHREGSLIPG